MDTRYEKEKQLERGLVRLTPEQDSGCERAIIFLLSQPDNRIVDAEPGRYVREELNLDIPDWQIVAKELLSRNILIIGKSNYRKERNDTLALNLVGLVESASQAEVPDYITHELYLAAQEAQTRDKISDPLYVIGAVAVRDQRTAIVSESI